MAANATGQGALPQILSALATMQSNVGGKDKAQAHELLEKFQKSVCFEIGWAGGRLADFSQQQEAWNATHTILQDSSTSPEARLFAATTLKGKVDCNHMS